MGVPSTQIIALWVQEELEDTGWSPLRTVAIAALQRRWTKPEQTIEELVDDHLDHVAEMLRNELADRAIDGKVADIEVDEETPPYIRRIFPRRPTILHKLRRIDPFEFEQVCARVLQALGADAATTQRTVDGGIDFTATKLKIIHGQLPMPASCHGVVIGQAKRYKEGNVISETKLREFVGASILKRHRMSTEGVIAPLMPTLYAFWTTSDLEPNAKKYARAVGLWYMDGVTLSAYTEELGLTGYIENLTESMFPKTI